MSPMRQKGKRMNEGNYKKGNYCRTLQLSWEEVADLLSDYVSRILERKIYGTADYEDYDYWDFSSKEKRFTIVEISRLIQHVQGEDEMWRESIPTDSNTSSSLGLCLSRALLGRALEVNWNHESMNPSALWLIDVQEHRAIFYQRFVNVGADMVFLDDLKSKGEAVTYLHENLPTHSVLMDFCEDYRNRYHNELCWNYPISDGKHLGTFFLLVKEGVLRLPYDDADKVDYELLCLDDARLCDKESLSVFIDDWESFERDLRTAMYNMLDFYRREEEHNEENN